MKINQVILFVLISIFSFSCSSSKKLERELAQRPEWVQKTPQSPFFYNGIGIVSKENSNYKEVARKLALENISNEISVNISGESVLNSIETNTSFQQEFKQQIKLSSEKYLEGYELVDSYETEEYYYVYYQLSKSKYEELKRERLEQSKQKSLLFYKNSKTFTSKGQYRESLNALIQSMEPLVEYLDQKIEFTENDSVMNLPLSILNEYKAIEQSIRLEAFQPNISITYGDYVPNDAIGVTALDQNSRAIGGIPLKFEYKTLYTQTKTVITTADGEAFFSMGKIRSKIKEQYIRVTPDFDQILQEQTKNRIVRGLLKTNIAQEVLIKLIVDLPKVYIEGSFDDVPSVFLSNLKNAFLMNEFEVVKDVKDADLICVIDLKESYNQGLKSFEVGGSLSFYDSNRKLVYSAEIPFEKGLHVSKSTARQIAYEEMSAQFKKRLIPLFSTKYFED